MVILKIQLVVLMEPLPVMGQAGLLLECLGRCPQLPGLINHKFGFMSLRWISASCKPGAKNHLTVTRSWLCNGREINYFPAGKQNEQLAIQVADQ